MSSDDRLGRVPGAPTGSTSARRPAFRTPSGDDFEADAAIDAARAQGLVRGDLRGEPSKESPAPSLVRERRRRAVVDEGKAFVEPEQRSARADRQPPRDEREYGDRHFAEDRELTDEERLAMLRQGFFQVVLPDLPRKPGFHRVWLTTTNPRDTVAGRLRMGYRLLRFEDLGAGWEQSKAVSGEYAGCIMINEMIAAELPEHLYQMFMRELHHNMPREAERGIFGRLDEYKDDLAHKGSRLLYEESDGNENAFEALRANNPRPKQFE